MTVELNRQDIIDIFCGLAIYSPCPYYNSLIKHNLGTSRYENWGWNEGCDKIAWDKKSKGWGKFTDEQLWNMYLGLKKHDGKIFYSDTPPRMNLWVDHKEDNI